MLELLYYICSILCLYTYYSSYNINLKDVELPPCSLETLFNMFCLKAH